MSEIIKTWPAFMSPKKVLRVFNHRWVNFYFSVGKGKPKQEVTHLWFTHRGRILGRFKIVDVVKNDGSLPKLRSLQNRASEWQFKPDVWVAICEGPVERIKEKLCYGGFRGWRYFSLEEYRKTVDAKISV